MLCLIGLSIVSFGYPFDPLGNYSLRNYNTINNNSYIWSYIIYCSIFDGVMGILTMRYQILLVEVVIKEHAGSVNGCKEAISQVLRGTAPLIIGLLWDTSLEFLWAIQTIILICVIVAIIIAHVVIKHVDKKH